MTTIFGGTVMTTITWIVLGYLWCVWAVLIIFYAEMRDNLQDKRFKGYEELASVSLGLFKAIALAPFTLLRIAMRHLNACHYFGFAFFGFSWLTYLLAFQQEDPNQSLTTKIFASAFLATGFILSIVGQVQEDSK